MTKSLHLREPGAFPVGDDRSRLQDSAATLLQRLRKEAPHSELVLSAVGPQTFDDVAAGRIGISQLCAEEVLPHWKAEVIFNLDFVCLVGSVPIGETRPLTLKQYLNYRMPMNCRTSSTAIKLCGRPRRKLGLKRRVALRIPFFISAVFAAAQTASNSYRPSTLAKITAPMAAVSRDDRPPARSSFSRLYELAPAAND